MCTVVLQPPHTSYTHKHTVTHNKVEGKDEGEEEGDRDTQGRHCDTVDRLE